MSPRREAHLRRPPGSRAPGHCDFRWARRYTGAGAFDQQTPDALAVHGGVYVAGVQEGVSNDAMLVKYKP